jgi:pyridoxal phosphate enzyme (YggS family)
VTTVGSARFERVNPYSCEEVLENLRTIREGIARACVDAGREASEVRLVAASKTVPPEIMGWVRDAGVEDFGENYVQELSRKHAELSSVRWHFIGTLQASGAHHVAALADVVQTLEPGKAVERLARRTAEAGHSIPSLIEVELTSGRTGVRPEDLAAFADEVSALEGITLVGLMTLPPIPETPDETRPYFRRLRELRDSLVPRHPGLVELSMGMSLDYTVAVEEGATMVRVGTALFGERPPTK